MFVPVEYGQTGPAIESYCRDSLVFAGPLAGKFPGREAFRAASRRRRRHTYCRQRLGNLAVESLAVESMDAGWLSSVLQLSEGQKIELFSELPLVALDRTECLDD